MAEVLMEEGKPSRITAVSNVDLPGKGITVRQASAGMGVGAALFAVMMLVVDSTGISLHPLAFVASIGIPSTGTSMLLECYWQKNDLLTNRNAGKKSLVGEASAEEVEAARKNTGKKKAVAMSEDRALEERWMKYQTDLDLILQYPLMVDLEDEQVRRASYDYLEMVAARERGPGELRRATNIFSVSLDAAEARARRFGEQAMDPTERSSVEHIKRLIAQAENTPHEHERVLAYKQALKALSGVSIIPQRGVEKIQHQARLAIEA